MSYIFLTLAQILRLHRRLIETSGGSPGLRDQGTLESALAAAENRFYYKAESLPVLVATYAYHLTKAHAFVDGNKRIAAAAAEAFVRLNHARIESSDQDLLTIMLAVSANECTRDELEEFFSRVIRSSEF